MDAVDTALINIKHRTIELVAFREYPIPEDIRTPLRAMNENTPLKTVAMMDVRIGELFAEAALELIAGHGVNPEDIAAIGSHGQTVFHSPGSKPPCTVQIGDPNVIASRTGITTVADFRRMDVANGGQGAPFAPLFHQALFQTDHARIVLNIGGIANLTLLSAEADAPLTGFDSGPGNGLMDDWIQRHQSRAFDENGLWAGTGKVSKDLLKILLEDDYFAKRPPKSTGRDDFNLDWLQGKIDRLGNSPKPEDVQATLLALTAKTISEAIHNSGQDPDDILVCGGGVHNGALMDRLASAVAPVPLMTTGEAGMDGNAIEAGCFAWLAGKRINNEKMVLKELTGSDRPVTLGGIYSP
jgi:anhydro-N-acetylmuramic acid kinase